MFPFLKDRMFDIGPDMHQMKDCDNFDDKVLEQVKCSMFMNKCVLFTPMLKNSRVCFVYWFFVWCDTIWCLAFSFSVCLVIGGSLALVCRNLNDAIFKFGGIGIVQEIGRKPFWLEVRFEGMQWVYELVQQMDSV
jgi:hypothetical protein